MNFNETVGSIVYDFSRKKSLVKVSSQSDYNKYFSNNKKAADIIRNAKSVEWATKELEKIGIKGVKLELKSKNNDQKSDSSKPRVNGPSSIHVEDPSFEKVEVDPGRDAGWGREKPGVIYGDEHGNNHLGRGEIYPDMEKVINHINKVAEHTTKGAERSAKVNSKIPLYTDRKNKAKIELFEAQTRSEINRLNTDNETYTSQADADRKEHGARGKKADLEGAQYDRQNEAEVRKHADAMDRAKRGTVAHYGDKILRNIDATSGRVGGVISGAADIWENTANAVKAADRRLFDVDKSKVKGYVKHSKKAEELRSLADKASEGDYKNNLLEKAERAEDKANEKYETARAQKRQESLKTASNVFGSLKDTLSSKSRARTLAERGQAGVKRREAQIAYAMGDHSFFTKLAAGKSFGSRNAFTRAIGKIPGWLMYGRKEGKARKNYATQLAYGGFSEGATLAQTMIHDFSDFDDLMEQTTGEGWQYREYPELAKILDDDKYEKLDQKMMESGEFSEGEGETPPDGIIDSDSLRPGREEVTVNDILSKNYYTASPVEKKFQEMIARGFSESNSTPYENFLQSFSDSADDMRMM